MPVTPGGPKNFLRFGDASHFLLSFTSWWAITVGMGSPVRDGRTATAADSRAGDADSSTGRRQTDLTGPARRGASSAVRPRRGGRSRSPGAHDRVSAAGVPREAVEARL